MSVDLGFETIGNATCTVFDSGKSILTTDPWIFGNPYFGSWTHKYEIPVKQKQNIFNAEYFWISHGHPDHLDIESLKLIKETEILIPDHYGNRMFNELTSLGYKVTSVLSGVWIQLSNNIRIKSFADWNQDGLLLIEISGKNILINVNDGSLRGIKHTLKNEISSYENRFLLRLVGALDADMCNIYDEQDNFINHERLLNNPNLGKKYSYFMEDLNCNYAIPFSLFHQYQREDSFHINQYIKPLEDHFVGFDKSKGNLLPAFIIWDCEKDSYTEIKPKIKKINPIPAEHYQDDWSESLDKDDKDLIDKYFSKIKTITSYIGKIHFNCGLKIHTVNISKCNTEILFEVPRHSLMEAIKYNVFDDLMIGNFMRTKLINTKSLYPYFTPYVAKYYDNGGVKDVGELKSYFNHYKRKSPSKINFMQDKIMRDMKNYTIYNFEQLGLYQFARFIYRAIKY